MHCPALPLSAHWRTLDQFLFLHSNRVSVFQSLSLFPWYGPLAGGRVVGRRQRALGAINQRAGRRPPLNAVGVAERAIPNPRPVHLVAQLGRQR